MDTHHPAVLRPQMALLALAGSACVTVGVFLSGFVISEPAPYELFMAGMVGVWFLLGLKISRKTFPLFGLLITFNVGGLLSLTVMKELNEGPMYIAVSIFLALTAIFYAAIVEERHQRLALIFDAWTAAATITSILGILGYFHAFPGAEVFTLYDRAKGAFQDPNVFGPYLVPPSMFMIHGILTGRARHMPLRIAILGILTLGVLLSFSRAAWGLYVLCAILVIMLMLLKDRSGTFRLKVLLIAMSGFIAIVVTIVVALQIKQVSDMLISRSALVQQYDGDREGRFARHAFGFLLSMEKPLGIGPLVFSKLYFKEDEHNIWLKSLTSYGWLGLVAYVSLALSTIAVGFRLLLRERPWQPYLMIAWTGVVGHIAIANVIDIDHWRHMYLLYGIVWGCHALEHHYQKALRQV